MMQFCCTFRLNWGLRIATFCQSQFRKIVSCPLFVKIFPWNCYNFSSGRVNQAILQGDFPTKEIGFGKSWDEPKETFEISISVKSLKQQLHRWWLFITFDSMSWRKLPVKTSRMEWKSNLSLSNEYAFHGLSQDVHLFAVLRTQVSCMWHGFFYAV